MGKILLIVSSAAAIPLSLLSAFINFEIALAEGTTSKQQQKHVNLAKASMGIGAVSAVSLGYGVVSGVRTVICGNQ